MMLEVPASGGPGRPDQFGLGVSGDGDGAGGLVGAPCCMSGIFRIPGMSCIPPGCPRWGSIMAMFRQHGHMPPVDWPGCAGWAACPGCWAWAVVDGVPHIIAPAVAVEPVACAAA
ncbi:hypothetical protein VB618_15405 [Microvirga sp. CF3062]|uniref:hypothetical protein n=1 Tax=Microvirga sp. CF3062 TaxID=3110182 RepID=UPI002E7A5C62|nr:hypothetical protein [Microvirga sp. CF3062]MEE1657593.1 hypothetical protein [Microvirga sp. CF3062]